MRPAVGTGPTLSGKHDKAAAAEARSDLLHTGPIAIRGMHRATRDFFRTDRANKHRASPEGSEGEPVLDSSASEDVSTSVMPGRSEQHEPTTESRSDSSTRPSAAFVRPASTEEDERVLTAQIPLKWMFGSTYAPGDDVVLARARCEAPTRSPMAYPAALDPGALEALRRTVEAMASDMERPDQAASHEEPAVRRSILPPQPGDTEASPLHTAARSQGTLGEFDRSFRPSDGSADELEPPTQGSSAPSERVTAVEESQAPLRDDYLCEGKEQVQPDVAGEQDTSGGREVVDPGPLPIAPAESAPPGDRPHETHVLPVLKNGAGGDGFVEAATAEFGADREAEDAEGQDTHGSVKALQDVEANDAGAGTSAPGDEPVEVDGRAESTADSEDQQMNEPDDAATAADASLSAEQSLATEAGPIRLGEAPGQLEVSPDEPQDAGASASGTDASATAFSEGTEVAGVPTEEPATYEGRGVVDDDHAPLADHGLVSSLAAADGLDAETAPTNSSGVLSWPSRPELAYEAVAAALEAARVEPDARTDAGAQGNEEQARDSSRQDVQPRADEPGKPDERATQEDPAAEQDLDSEEPSRERKLLLAPDDAPGGGASRTERVPLTLVGSGSPLEGPEEPSPSRDVTDAGVTTEAEVPTTTPVPAPQEQGRAPEPSSENQGSTRGQRRLADGTESSAEQAAARPGLAAVGNQRKVRPTSWTSPPRSPRPRRAPRPPQFTRGGGGGRVWGYLALAMLAVICIALVVAVIVKTRNDATIAAKAAAAYTPPPPLTTAPTSSSAAASPVVSVAGDEFTAGTSADSGTRFEWPALLQAALKAHVKTYAAQGAGYLTTGSGGATLVTEAGKVDPSSTVVLIVGGANDQLSGDALAVAEAATRAISAAHTAAPKATIVLVGPASGLATPPASLTTISNALQGAAGAAGAQWVDPISDHWLSSSPSLSDAQGRPTDAGEKAIESNLQAVLENSV